MYRNTHQRGIVYALLSRAHAVLQCCALALTVFAAHPCLPAEEETQPAYTAKVVDLPRAARQHIFQAPELLRKSATRLFRDDKPILDVWLPQRMPSPDGLFDGSLLAILAPPRNPRPEKTVTVRTMEKGMRVDFSTLEREETKHTILKLRAPLKTWRRLDESRPLALVASHEPVWLDRLARGPWATLDQEADELYLTLALRPEEKQGARWQLPPRIRKLLGL
jgi:hypothetical protein